MKFGSRGDAAQSALSDHDESATDLRLAVRNLPEEMRLAVVLRYYMDLSFDEIGGVLGVSAPAAKARVHRALVRLRVEVTETNDNA